MDKLREEFECWYAKKFEEDNGFPPTRDISELRGKDGEYSDLAYLHGCWIGWKASRESLVIELPAIYNKDWSCNASECEAMRNGIVITKHVIHAAGVRTK